MDDIVDPVGPNRALAIFGVKLVGAKADNAKKLFFTLVFVLLVVLVRGDVIALGFTQTTIMEMGQSPPVQRDEPAM